MLFRGLRPARLFTETITKIKRFYGVVAGERERAMLSFSVSQNACSRIFGALCKGTEERVTCMLLETK